MPSLSIEPNPRITFAVRHEDDDVLVVDKPPGLATQPGLGHTTDTLLNGLFALHGPRLQNLGRKRDFGLLHRLDRFASGLLVVALRPRAYDRLRDEFHQRRIAKFYWALTRSAPREPTGVIDRPIIEIQRAKRTARISRAGKPASTAYRVLSSTHLGSLIECRPVTGRLHQVRVHLDLIGCPILGDDLYGPGAVRAAAPRLALHAHRLRLDHPSTGGPLDVRSPWPGDLRALLRRLGLPRPDLVGSAQDTEKVARDGVSDEHAPLGEPPAPV